MGALLWRRYPVARALLETLLTRVPAFPPDVPDDDTSELVRTDAQLARQETEVILGRGARFCAYVGVVRGLTHARVRQRSNAAWRRHMRGGRWTCRPRHPSFCAYPTVCACLTPLALPAARRQPSWPH
jgi:hypothetical protein